MKPLKSAISLLVISSFVAHACAAVEEPAESSASCQLKVATGQRGKGYSKLFADVQAVCGSKVPMCEVQTEGGLQNLSALSNNEADVGFVQLDTLKDLRESDASIGALQALMSLNSNLLHIVARAEGYSWEGPTKQEGVVFKREVRGDRKTRPLSNLSDLNGLHVAVVGSAQKLGREVDRRHNLNIQFDDVQTDEQALTMLNAGQVAAVFSTSGWPSGPVSRLRRDSGLKLLDFDKPQAMEPTIKKNYANIGAYNVVFLAAPNLLVTRPFSPKGPNGRNVTALQTCILKNLSALQEGRTEPAWQEVKNPTETFGWPRFGGVQRR
jgi:TRAP-type uncharacterized transport system substrate-binding protein